MQVVEKEERNMDRKKLKDFIPLAIAFFGSLVFLSIYQNIRLYASGILDGFINKSLFLLLLHHTGFTAIMAIVLAFLFNFIERKKARLGFKVAKIILLVFLLVEGWLIEYYVRNYEILGDDVFGLNVTSAQIASVLLYGSVLMIGSGILFHFLYKMACSTYTIISRMYPFTIVLFSLFLATLAADKKPINENRVQHLVTGISSALLDFNKYEGSEEYPLLKPYAKNDVFGGYFNLKNERPNMVILIVEGLGSDFVGDKALYKGFAPFLDSLRGQSLYWDNFVSNTGESFAAMPTILGSLPFGEKGFTNIEGTSSRNTLFGILKKNGYATSFNYGGNSALNHFDKFLDEERVDFILDRKAFGPDYKLQEEDAAGISLGYPDKELFRKWAASTIYQKKPKLEVFLTLSSKTPFAVPYSKTYQGKVETILAKSQMAPRISKLIKKNKEIFASILYTDEALAGFFASYKNRPEFGNTIFIVTGSHNLTELPARNEASRYRVPLIIYSPLLKSPKKMKYLVSHADIVPTLVSLLDEEYHLKIPQKVAWLGNSLLLGTPFDDSKEIPLFRNKNSIQDYIYGPFFLSAGQVYKFDRNLEPTEVEDAPVKTVKKSFDYFRSINAYTTANDKILPDSMAIFNPLKNKFTKQELVWISSVFNGRDFDGAYETARELAFKNEMERAFLLCRYIIVAIPRHADAEILMGRMHAWQGDYGKAMDILEETVRKYPVYVDGYSALLDVYFWADKNEKAIDLQENIKRNNIKSIEITQKMVRAYQQTQKGISKDTLASFSINPEIQASITAIDQ